MSTAPAGWGEPSPVYNFCTGEYETGGIVWIPNTEPTQDDIGAGIAWVGFDGIDWPTVFGYPSSRDIKLLWNPGGCYSGKK
jgi:hypothetical protein